MVYGSVAVDVHSLLHSGDYLLTVTDEYSRFVEVGLTKSTCMKSVTPKGDRAFSLFGTPFCVKSVNSLHILVGGILKNSQGI